MHDDGAQHVIGALGKFLPGFHAAVIDLGANHGGVRISDASALLPFLMPSGAIGSIAAGALGEGCRAVRAILFNKTAASNWSLAWHQDRTICVKRRIETPGFGPWTVKR